MLQRCVFLLLLTAATVFAQNEGRPTLYIVGDSTAHNTTGALRGWGDVAGEYFDTSRINVENRARGGRSSRTFLTEGHWDSVAAELKPGDFVLLQFGHNDGGAPATGRGSLPGLGEDTVEVSKPDGSKEVVHTYGWYHRKFIADTRAKGATPILLTVTLRNIWTDGTVEHGVGHYTEWEQKLAAHEHVALADMAKITVEGYEKMGPEKVKAFFPGDHTHTSEAGARYNAEAVVKALRALPDCALAEYGKQKSED